MIHRERFHRLLPVVFVMAILLINVANASAAQAGRLQEKLVEGETALNQRKYEAAVALFKEVVRDSRSQTAISSELAIAQSNFGLSRAYLGLGAFKNAIQSCDEALKYTGASRAMEAMVRNQRGLALVASAVKPGDASLQEAVAEFRAVMAITDQDPMVAYNLGVTLLKLERDAEGVHELRTFLSRAGNIPEVETARRMIDQPRRARENFAPDFALTTRDGEYLTLDDLKGKVVLLDFWGSWCPPCRESTPSLVRYSKKHPPGSFVMIGVAVNEASDSGWRDYISENNMVWPQYLDSTRKIANLFKVTVFPTYIILDADGVIRDRRTGWTTETMNSIDNQVKRAIKAGPAPPRPAREISVNSTAPTAATDAPAGARPIAPPSSSAQTGIQPLITSSASPDPAANGSPTAAAVRGRVIRPAAQTPLTGIQQVTLASPGNPARLTPINMDGSFEFVNVRPGVYSLLVPAPVPPRSIVVTGDLNGIEINVPVVKPVVGRFIIEGVASAAPGSGASPRLLFRLTGSEGISNTSTLGRADGAFTVALPEGERGMVLNAPGYLVKSLLYGTTDLLQNPIIKIAGSDNAELRVTLVAAPASTAAAPGAAGGRGVGASPVVPAAGNAGRGSQVPAAMTEPQAIYRVEPEYTPEARQARQQGTVSLQAVVRTDGTIGAVKVVNGIGYGLDEAATQAVRQYRFLPATRNGEPVESVITIQIGFSLR